jgi:hypothetical protein
VVTFLEHLLREVPGRLVFIWDGSPIHRSHTILRTAVKRVRRKPRILKGCFAGAGL